MTVLKTRSRMVSVRLSEDEYSALRELCFTTGARSVSDLTRDAMHAFLTGATREQMLHMRMNEFCDQMNDLGRRIDELVEKFAPLSKQIADQKPCATQAHCPQSYVRGSVHQSTRQRILP